MSEVDRLLAEQAERQRIAAAKLDADEAAAPLIGYDELPLTVPTLKFIEPNDRRFYGRLADGSFRLRCLDAADDANIAAHAGAVADGSIVLFSPEEPGDTPETVAARRRAANDAMANKARAEVARLQKIEDDARAAVLQAERDRATAALEAEQREAAERQARANYDSIHGSSGGVIAGAVASGGRVAIG